MADQLATPSDLAAVLQTGTVDTATATALIEMATAVVQEACGGQRIVQVIDDMITLAGYTDAWLRLPQIPVTAVAQVVMDGATLTAGTDYKVFGNRLWRKQGWQANYGWPWSQEGIGAPWYTYAPPSLTWPYQEPSTIQVTCTHGYPPGAQELQLARSAVISLVATAYSNPSGASSESIDDYRVSFDPRTRMELTQHMRALLRRRYGHRGALMRVG